MESSKNRIENKCSKNNLHDNFKLFKNTKSTHYTFNLFNKYMLPAILNKYNIYFKLLYTTILLIYLSKLNIINSIILIN